MVPGKSGQANLRLWQVCAFTRDYSHGSKVRASGDYVAFKVAPRESLIKLKFGSTSKGARDQNLPGV